MWIAHVICSGRDCTEELELVVDTLDELERINCECGYGLAVLSVAEASPFELQSGEVLAFSRHDDEHSDSRRAAA